MKLEVPFVADFEKLSSGRYVPDLYARRCTICRTAARRLASRLTFRHGDPCALVQGLAYTSSSGSFAAMWNCNTECYCTDDPPTARRYLLGIALVTADIPPHCDDDGESVHPVAIWEVRDGEGSEIGTEYTLV